MFCNKEDSFMNENETKRSGEGGKVAVQHRNKKKVYEHCLQYAFAVTFVHIQLDLMLNALFRQSMLATHVYQTQKN